MKNKYLDRARTEFERGRYVMNREPSLIRTIEQILIYLEKEDENKQNITERENPEDDRY